MKHLLLPLLGLGFVNIGEYGALTQWGVVEPWEHAWHRSGAALNPDALILCVASVVVIATVGMAMAVSYPTLHTNFTPAEARLRALFASAMAFPCLLCLLWCVATAIPLLFFVLLFPLIPFGVSLPFILALTMRFKQQPQKRLVVPVRTKP